ncbi:DNA-directed RNA polymerase III subunit RPC6 [Eurytemora carolleeae]|uniref:DNA-directed RNA polymerase III subunit RPC6 n=1 Tax=Eurytemora carolleeae TaxID=1294199 RepID=UPI000C774C9F|nr:DNA-directed RNA polymerase III subunit RPC6 [Eurytemora carolleeae]|eukprot:XP_023339940.1 DNA-directed RNA polymerase III subunit RPC6-like [Eurytemora affinis]
MTEVKTETGEIDDFCAKISALCEEMPDGINDKVIQNELPTLDPRIRAQCINRLLVAGKIDLFKSTDGLMYKFKAPTRATNIRGDQEEKIVFKIIETSGNLGIWLRDIRTNSGLLQTQLNKVLKSLETKKLIKAVKCVNATKKKVYMLYDLEPDRTVTGIAVV